MQLSLRAAGLQDEEFLFDLYKASMQKYVVATWGEWDEEAQRDQFRREYTPAETRVIQADGQDVGLVQVQERTEERFLVNLEILPSFQNLGIGTWVLQQIIQDARWNHKPVALQVLKVNLAARALYQKLGFGITGENDTHYILAYELH